jgi:hypothetical protein
MLICEEAYKLFNASRFQIFNRYCEYIRNYIVADGNDSPQEAINIQVNLIIVIRDIYGFTDDDCLGYVREFFIKKVYEKFGEIVRLQFKYFEKPMDNLSSHLPQKD